MKKYIFLMFVLPLSLASFAQGSEDEDETKNERIETLKIGFITEKLSLTSKEAEIFWPVFNRFEKEIKAVRKKQRDASNAFKVKTNVTDQEAEKFVAEQLLLKQQELDVLKKFIPEFKKVLPAAKVAKLLSLEQEFKVELLRKLKERRGTQR